jgi:hypothetical protein
MTIEQELRTAERELRATPIYVNGVSLSSLLIEAADEIQRLNGQWDELQEGGS